MKKQLVSVFCLFIIAMSAHADGTHPRGIKTDGTVGSAGSADLPGPDYEIRAGYGQQVGANLFHSFQQFNIHADETATFTGPDSIQNIISRVTGGAPSWIDGKLGSVVPNADIWFLNPAGLVFGPDASLELPGSFHAGTGDYLRMGENQRFLAQPLQNEVLSVAPPTAFGFLADTPAPIVIQESSLSVSEGKTLSLTGGDIQMSGTQQEDSETGETEYVSGLSAESGEISLVSAASSGEVAPGPGGINLSDPAQGGTFTANHVRIDVSGKRGGCIFIHAGDVEVTASRVISEISGDQDGSVTEIHAENMILNESAEIASITQGSGDSGDIALFVADTLTISDGKIVGHSFDTEPDAGTGGQIGIEAGRIILTDRGSIGSDTYGLGEAGTITIRVSDTLTISGKNEKPGRTGIKTNTHSTLPGAGNGGRVDIEAGRIIITDGGHVASDTFGAGDSGTVFLKAGHGLEVSGGNIMSMSKSTSGPETNPEESETATGNAGLIEIEAGHIRLTNDAEISTSTKGPGNGGSIRIVAEEITLTERAHISSETSGQGEAGTVTIRVADTLTISGENGNPDRTGIETNTHSPLADAGAGGQIEIEAGEIILRDGGHVASDTFGAGNSGSVLLSAGHTLEVSGGKIMSMSGIPGGDGTGDEGTSDSQARQDTGATEPITNSEDSQMPTGNAGHIEIRAGQITLTNDAEIATFTTGIGQGGTIHIIAGDMRISESEISAYSQSEEPGAGQAGNVEVEADTVHLLNQGIITAETANAAGGNMIFEIPGFLYLLGGQITTSVQGGADDGGNITVSAPGFVVLNSGKVRANAYEGRGGNIRITAEQFIQASNSTMEASSEKGIDGSINIESPDTDIGSGLTVMPGTFIDAARWAVTPCSQRSGADVSRFEIRGRDGIALSFGGFRPSPPMWSHKKEGVRK